MGSDFFVWIACESHVLFGTVQANFDALFKGFYEDFHGYSMSPGMLWFYVKFLPRGCKFSWYNELLQIFFVLIICFPLSYTRCNGFFFSLSLSNYLPVLSFLHFLFDALKEMQFNMYILLIVSRWEGQKTKNGFSLGGFNGAMGWQI